jgi:hypothetical protein
MESGLKHFISIAIPYMDDRGVSVDRLITGQHIFAI